MAKKILIIEDEQTIIKALSEGLKSPGESYVLETASDGDEGLKKAKEFAPDLILLDLILPKMDGFNVLRNLKEDKITKEIKIIVLTNLSDVTEKVMEMGALDCLVKSDFSIRQIEEAVKKSF